MAHAVLRHDAQALRAPSVLDGVVACAEAGSRKLHKAAAEILGAALEQDSQNAGLLDRVRALADKLVKSQQDNKPQNPRRAQLQRISAPTRFQ